MSESNSIGAIAPPTVTERFNPGRTLARYDVNHIGGTTLDNVFTLWYKEYSNELYILYDTMVSTFSELKVRCTIEYRDFVYFVYYNSTHHDY